MTQTMRSEFHQVYHIRLFDPSFNWKIQLNELFLPLKIELRMVRTYNYFGDTKMEMKIKCGDFNEARVGQNNYKRLAEISKYRNQFILNDDNDLSSMIQTDFSHNDTFCVFEKE
jgi:hypothetical protein